MKYHILWENKGLTLVQFKKKHGIEENREDQIDPDIVQLNLLYFKFKDGVLNDIVF